MKYIVILTDGMSDMPCEKLSFKTPMELAKKPFMDSLFKRAVYYGTAKTIPNGMKPGSDVANLSVMGYNPSLYYTGRSPLEAVSMGVSLSKFDIALRANLVTLSDCENFSDKTMLDYCGGDISTSEAKILIDYLKEHLDTNIFSLTAGVSYRHLLVMSDENSSIKDTSLIGFAPPHDFTGGKIQTEIDKATSIINVDSINLKLLEIIKKSYELLKDHPLNKKRIEEGKLPANALWLWGAGKKCILPNFKEKYSLSGSVISAVDLLKGIAISAGMDAPFIEGATGYIDTNFENKVQCAFSALKDEKDFVYIHIEAPDECGHRGEYENKIRAIELIDEKILGRLLQLLKKENINDYRILICPDHPTPLDLKTHTNDPVPYFIYDSTKEKDNLETNFTEKISKKGFFIPTGEELFLTFIN